MGKPEQIAPDERVVTAWAEYASGPGWHNSLVIALVSKRGTTDYRMVYLQPEEQTREMVTLRDVSATVAAKMTRLCAVALGESPR